MKTISTIFFYCLVLCCFIKTATPQATTQVDISVVNAIRGSTSTPVADHMTCLTYDDNVANQLMMTYQLCDVIPSGNNLAVDVIDTASVGGTGITERFASWMIDASGGYIYVSDDCTTLSATQCSNFKAVANDRANSMGCFQAQCSASQTICSAIQQDCTLTVCQFDADIPTGQPYVSSGCSDNNCTGCKGPSACSLSSMPAKSECTNYGPGSTAETVSTGGCCA